jgi:hypothetical protein
VLLNTYTAGVVLSIWYCVNANSTGTVTLVAAAAFWMRLAGTTSLRACMKALATALASFGVRAHAMRLVHSKPIISVIVFFILLIMQIFMHIIFQPAKVQKILHICNYFVKKIAPHSLESDFPFLPPITYSVSVL